MGRLADTYKGRKIISRLPYIMSSSVTIRSSKTGVQFPSAAFLHNNDKPFEIHRFIPVVLSVNALDPTQVVAVDDGRFIRGQMMTFGKNVLMTKASTSIASMLKSQTTERVWEWTDPLVLEKTQGFDNTIDSAVFDDTTNIYRVQWAYQGYLLTLGKV